MNKLTIISGGARSGKSRFAEGLATQSEKKVLYLATAIAFDEGMKSRISKHRESRPAHWNTIERYREFKLLEEKLEFQDSELILLDCLTLLISNLMLESGIDFDKVNADELDSLEKMIINELDALLNVIEENNKAAIIVTNEVGLGIVPDSKLGSIFRDIAGRANQYIAEKADEAYVVFLGIPLRLK